MRALLLVLLLGCGSEVSTPEERVDVARVLDGDAYRFCHEPGVFAEEAQQWCELLEDLPESQCPGLRETCAGAAPVAAQGCGEGGGGGGAGRGAVGGAPTKPTKRWQPEACALPDTVGGGAMAVLRWVLALLVALAVVAAARLLWRYIQLRSVPRVQPVVEVVPTVEDPVIEGVPDLPSVDLLAAAREALAAGEFGRAAVLARGAALRRLGDLGRVRLHRSRTDREYVRAVRRDDEVYGALRVVLDAVEAHRWGGTALDRTRSEAAVAAADQILKTVGVALLLLVALAGDAVAQSDRYGPVGDAGLEELLTAWGHDAGFRLRGLDTLDGSVDVLVLDTTFVAPEEDGWQVLRTWVEAGGVLLVGGPAAFEELGDYTMLVGPVSTEGTVALQELALPTPRWPEGPTAGWQASTGEAWVVATELEGDGDALPLAVIVAVPVGQGWLLGIADARLLWNGALVHPDNEHFLGDALHAVSGALGWADHSPLRVELATTAAASSPTPSSSILNADLLPFVIQLMISWALLALWVGWPFAPLRDPPDEGRLSFAEHVRALGRRWQTVGASRHALAAHGGLWLQRLGPSGIRQAAIRAGRDRTRADALVAALQAAVDDPTGPNSEHDLEWMEELCTITQSR